MWIFFYHNTRENATKLYNALNDFWSGDIPDIANWGELEQTGLVVQFGVPPSRIYLINRIENVSFNEAWPNKKIEKTKIKDRHVNVNFIGLKELIKNKKALKRYKDKEDLKYLIQRSSAEKL